jgi:hypothetical protein
VKTALIEGDEVINLNGELRVIYRSPIIVRVGEGEVRHIAMIGYTRNTYRILVGKHIGKRQ